MTNMPNPLYSNVENQTHIPKEDPEDITLGPYLIASISAIVMVGKMKKETKFWNGNVLT